MWTRWSHLYGSSIPYILPSKKAFGRELVPMYFEWRDHLLAESERVADAVRAEGETIGRIASNREANCSAPSSGSS